MTKKTYNSPELTVYGTVSELTHWYGTSSGSDVLYTSPEDDTVFATQNGASIDAVINPCLEFGNDESCGTNQ